MAGFRRAEPKQAFIKMALYGPAGSGKTFSTLLMAEGLARHMGKRVAYVDTERGTDFYAKDVADRTVHPQGFDFDALYTRSLTECHEALSSLNLKEHGVIVIDSITHFWEGAMNAYQGKRTRDGGIPMHAWGKVKSPYKRIIQFLNDSPCHTFVLGRQGTEYQEDERSELKAVGYKMKAEGETPYEPHILVRMDPEKQKNGAAVVQAFFEKDRTGVLAGRTIAWPDFDKVCKPLLPLLGGEQGSAGDSEAAAEQDADALARMDNAKREISIEHLKEFTKKLYLAESLEEVKSVGKEITPAIKKQMTDEDLGELRQRYLDTEAEMKKRQPVD